MITNPAISKLLPFKSNFLTIAGHRMHYIDEGSGPVVLLLHGNPTWCFYYRRLIGVLREKFRVIAPDYIGLGLSDHPRNARFRAIDRIEQVQELIAKLGLTRYSIVMHDWGGAIGTGVAVRNVAAVEKLVYLNTTLTETESLPFIIKISASPIFGRLLTRHTRRFLKFTTDIGANTKLPKEIKQGYYYPYRKAVERDAIWDFVQDIPFNSDHPSYAVMLDMADKIPQLAHVPVKIVWGLKDPCFHREMLTKVAEHFPQARVLEIPHASHLVLEDAPETANSAIREFLLEDISVPASVPSPLSEYGDQIRSHPGVNALLKGFWSIASSQPRQDAVVVPGFLGDTVRYAHFNYRAVGTLINKYQRGLTELGLSAGDRVLLLVPGGVDFIALTYAIMARGAVPFFVDPGIGRENLVRCIKEIEPNVFIGSPRAHLLRLLKPKLFGKLKFHLMASDWFFTGGPNLSLLKRFAPTPLPPVASPEGVFVGFTSGATGLPKGVIFTNEMLAEQLRIFSTTFGLAPGGKDLPLLPIFSLYMVALGVCTVFPPMDSAKPLALDPSRVVKVINDLGVNYSFGSPTLWNKIAEYCKRIRATLPTIRGVFMAGAAVPEGTLSRVCATVDHGKVYTPYGATEALPVTLVEAAEVLSLNRMPARGGEVGTYVGRAVDGVELKVIEVVGGPIDRISQAKVLGPGEIGEIIVKGANVSRRYFLRQTDERKAKIADGSEVWHRMGDVGYLDENGGLYYCGRTSHIVSYRDKIYYSVPIELIFDTHEKVKRSALISLGGREAAIAIEPYPQYWPESQESKAKFEEELRNLARKHSLTQAIEKVFFYKSFPVDARHNAKIFREKLGELATKGESLEQAA